MKEPPTKPRNPKLGRPFRTPLVYVVLVLAALWFFVSFATRAPEAQQVTFSELEQLAGEGKVSNAVFLERDQRVEGELVTGQPYSTPYPQEYQDELAANLQESGVPVAADAQKGSVFLNVILQILPFLLIFGFIIFLMQQGQGGGGRVMSFGKAKVRQVSKDEPKTTFEDVAGVDEAIEELQEVKEYLENPQKFQAMGAKVPKGVLLYGPPGTGKTLLARAVAGEAGVPFFSISGSDFVEMFVGVGAARVRDLFEQAKQTAPAIVFIDEIDAVGRHRGAGLGGGHDEREQTLNQLLVEMDGFDARTGVILMAATNRPDILDPALLRPGRFDRHVVIDRPDLEGRKGILRVHARGKPLAEGVNLDVVAQRTPGFTGADLANVVNESALLTARRGEEAIGDPELEEAIDRVIAGPERRTRVISDREKQITAYHESGHAVVGHALPNVPPLHKVTIIPRGMAGGYTLALPTEDRMYQTRAELIDQLAFALAGRVAEEIVFGDITTGAGDDIRKATSLARKMVTEYGMSDRLGPLTLGQREHEVFLGRDFAAHQDYSDQLAFEIDSEVRRLIDEAHDEALDVLTANRDMLDVLSAALIERETIVKEQLEEILGEVETRPSRDGLKNGEAVVARRSLRGRGDGGKGESLR